MLLSYLDKSILFEIISYVLLPDETYTIALDHFQQNKSGTAFAGKAQTNLKLEDLLQQEKTY